MNVQRTIAIVATISIMLMTGCSSTKGTTVKVTEYSQGSSIKKKVHVIVKGRLTDHGKVRATAHALATRECGESNAIISDVVNALIELYKQVPEHTYELKKEC